MPGIRASTTRHPFRSAPVGREERLAAGIGLGRMPCSSQQFLHVVARVAVVVDHENGGPRAGSRDDRRSRRLVGAFGCGASARKARICLRQHFRFGGLAEMHAAGVGDLAQGVARDVAGQDDGRYFAAQRLAQPRDDLGAGQIPRQVVVGDDDVRQAIAPRAASCERLVRAGDGGRPVSLVPRTASRASRAPRDRPRRSGSRR